jgi:diguanylate cyclase (GGDEF)-like protein
LGPGAGTAAGAPGATAGSGRSRGSASSPVHYGGVGDALALGLPARFAAVLTSIPDAMWAAILALLLLSAALAVATVMGAARARHRDRTIREMEALAYTDSLTGVLNRGALEQALRRELARAQRYGRPLGLLLFDVDGLKAINDRHGHGAGDDLLRAVGATLDHTIRDHDVCGRLGGDEYVVAVVEQGREGAEQVLDRVEAQIPERRATLGLPTPWGVSAGAASYPEDGETIEELIAAADRRLYASRGIRIDPG